MFGGYVSPDISRTNTAYIGEYLHFRYLKCLVVGCEVDEEVGMIDRRDTLWSRIFC